MGYLMQLMGVPGFQIFGLIGLVFFGWMLYDCATREPERQNWLYLLIFLNIMGAVVYFFARWLPRANLPVPKFMSRGKLREALWNAEAATRNIGKAHQFVTLGNILYEMDNFERAGNAYQQALEKEPNNVGALWGAASVELRNKNHAIAKEHLNQLLKLEPDHKFGDASLTYAHTLNQLQDWDALKPHLVQHIRNWSSPQAYLMLAELYQRQGETQQAREALETMIAKVRSAPSHHFRKNQGFVAQAEKMLKTLR